MTSQLLHAAAEATVDKIRLPCCCLLDASVCIVFSTALVNISFKNYFCYCGNVCCGL